MSFPPFSKFFEIFGTFFLKKITNDPTNLQYPVFFQKIKKKQKIVDKRGKNEEF